MAGQPGFFDLSNRLRELSAKGERQAARMAKWLDRQLPEPHRVAGDGPAGLGLPPVIDDRHAEQLLRPLDGRRIAALAGQEQGAKLRQVVVPQQLASVGLLLVALSSELPQQS